MLDLVWIDLTNNLQPFAVSAVVSLTVCNIAVAFLEYIKAQIITVSVRLAVP